MDESGLSDILDTSCKLISFEYIYLLMNFYLVWCV